MQKGFQSQRPSTSSIYQRGKRLESSDTPQSFNELQRTTDEENN